MSEAWNKLPPDPERDAFHILADGDVQYVVRWKPSRGWMDEYLPIWAYECSYVGQLYTEADVVAERDRLRASGFSAAAEEVRGMAGRIRAMDPVRLEVLATAAALEQAADMLEAKGQEARA